MAYTHIIIKYCEIESKLQFQIFQKYYTHQDYPKPTYKVVSSIYSRNQQFIVVIFIYL